MASSIAKDPFERLWENHFETDEVLKDTKRLQGVVAYYETDRDGSVRTVSSRTYERVLPLLVCTNHSDPIEATKLAEAIKESRVVFLTKNYKSLISPTPSHTLYISETQRKKFAELGLVRTLTVNLGSEKLDTAAEESKSKYDESQLKVVEITFPNEIPIKTLSPELEELISTRHSRCIAKAFFQEKQGNPKSTTCTIL